MTVQVDVQVASDDGSVPDSIDIRVWVERALAIVGHGDAAEVSVAVVGAREMQALNEEFRDKDEPTNVLSFPAGTLQGLPADAVQPLGDVVICAAVIGDEARQQGKPLADHWAHMIVHGTLHLLGLDHQDDAGAARMESLEQEVLSAHGIANPYGEFPVRPDTIQSL